MGAPATPTFCRRAADVIVGVFISSMNKNGHKQLFWLERHLFWIP